MPQTVAEVMTRNPVVVDPTDSITSVSELMRDEGLGAVLVCDDERLTGIVTDRDLVVRVLAEHLDPDETSVAEACSSEELRQVTPDTPLREVINIMRETAVRRVPVVEGDRPVGIVGLGDLAMERDENSVLADISAAEPDL